MIYLRYSRCFNANIRFRSYGSSPIIPAIHRYLHQGDSDKTKKGHINKEKSKDSGKVDKSKQHGQDTSSTSMFQREDLQKLYSSTVSESIPETDTRTTIGGESLIPPEAKSNFEHLNKICRNNSNYFESLRKLKSTGKIIDPLDRDLRIPSGKIDVDDQKGSNHKWEDEDEDSIASAFTEVSGEEKNHTQKDNFGKEKTDSDTRDSIKSSSNDIPDNQVNFEPYIFPSDSINKNLDENPDTFDNDSDLVGISNTTRSESGDVIGKDSPKTPLRGTVALLLEANLRLQREREAAARNMSEDVDLNLGQSNTFANESNAVPDISDSMAQVLALEQQFFDAINSELLNEKFDSKCKTGHHDLKENICSEMDTKTSLRPNPADSTLNTFNSIISNSEKVSPANLENNLEGVSENSFANSDTTSPMYRLNDNNNVKSAFMEQNLLSTKNLTLSSNNPSMALSKHTIHSSNDLTPGDLYHSNSECATNENILGNEEDLKLKKVKFLSKSVNDFEKKRRKQLKFKKTTETKTESADLSNRKPKSNKKKDEDADDLAEFNWLRNPKEEININPTDMPNYTAPESGKHNSKSNTSHEPDLSATKFIESMWASGKNFGTVEGTVPSKLVSENRQSRAKPIKNFVKSEDTIKSIQDMKWKPNKESSIQDPTGKTSLNSKSTKSTLKETAETSLTPGELYSPNDENNLLDNDLNNQLNTKVKFEQEDKFILEDSFSENDFKLRNKSTVEKQKDDMSKNNNIAEKVAEEYDKHYKSEELVMHEERLAAQSPKYIKWNDIFKAEQNFVDITKSSIENDKIKGEIKSTGKVEDKEISHYKLSYIKQSITDLLYQWVLGKNNNKGGGNHRKFSTTASSYQQRKIHQSTTMNESEKVIYISPDLERQGLGKDRILKDREIDYQNHIPETDSEIRIQGGSPSENVPQAENTDDSSRGIAAEHKMSQVSPNTPKNNNIWQNIRFHSKQKLNNGFKPKKTTK